MRVLTFEGDPNVVEIYIRYLRTAADTMEPQNSAASRRSKVVSQLSRWTLFGVLATVVGTIAFILQADAAVEGDGLAAFDPQLTQAFFDHRSAALSKVAQAVTF